MNLLQYVNTKQGSRSTHAFSHGNTLPLVQRPFGFVAFTLQTEKNDTSWFYDSDRDNLCGIRATHQPSPWIGDRSPINLLPQIGIPATDEETRKKDMDIAHSEIAPHLLSLTMDKGRTHLSLSPTEYGAVAEVSFDTDDACFLSFFSVRGKNSFRYDRERAILYALSDDAEARLRPYDAYPIKGYYAIRFDAEDVLTDEITVSRSDAIETVKALATDGEHIAIHVALKNRRVRFSIAKSYISFSQAEHNLAAHGTCNLERTVAENAALWESYIGRVTVDADEETKKNFYSCMYRAFLYPHKAHEPSSDGTPYHYAPQSGKVMPGVRYTDNGFWDTYRTVYPFFSIVIPEMCEELLSGFLTDYVDGGWLPCWTAGDAKKCMPSTAIDAVIADLAVKGLLSEKTLKTAFAGMEKHANTPSPIEAYGREGCSDYLALGYVPCDKYKESVNLTLDAAYFDFCLAEVARLLGKTDKEAAYRIRAKRYENIFDKSVGFMRGKESNGSFRDEVFSPIAWGRDYTEAAAWQTSLAVQHDVEGLVSLHGGRDAFLEKLDALFATPPDFEIGGYPCVIHEMREMEACDWGQCAVSNQPSFHIPFLYAYLGEREKADYWVHKIAREGFSYKEDGFSGDEDNGSMALWYVFAAIGIYPICPGKPIYTRTTPFVKNIRICGKQFRLPTEKNLVTHDEVMDAFAK